MKASGEVRRRRDRPATSTKFQASMVVDGAKRTSVEPEKKLEDETYESTVDSGFLSGSMSSSSWDVDDQLCSGKVTASSDLATEDRRVSCSDLKTAKCRDSDSEHEKWIREAFEPDDDGDTHLHLAVVQGIPDIVSCIVERVSDPAYLSSVNCLHQTPLHLAVLTHCPKIVRMLVASGASLEARDRRGNTPLHIACMTGDLECVKQLTVPFSLTKVDKSMSYFPDLPQDLEIKNYDGYSCLHLATFVARLDIIEHLAKYGANVNIKDCRSGCTPLHHSVQARNIEITKFLLEKCRSDPKVQTYKAATPLQQLQPFLNSSDKRSYKKVIAIRDLLHRHGAELDSEDSDSDDGEAECASRESLYSDLTINGQRIFTQ